MHEGSFKNTRKDKEKDKQPRRVCTYSPKKFFLLSTELLLCNKKSIMKGFVSCRIKMRLIFYKNDSCWLEQSLGSGHAKFQVWRINKIRSPLSRNLRPCLLLNWQTLSKRAIRDNLLLDYKNPWWTVINKHTNNTGACNLHDAYDTILFH